MPKVNIVGFNSILMDPEVFIGCFVSLNHINNYPLQTISSITVAGFVSVTELFSEDIYTLHCPPPNWHEEQKNTEPRGPAHPTQPNPVQCTGPSKLPLVHTQRAPKSIMIALDEPTK